jgi:vesicle coat complex subunit
VHLPLDRSDIDKFARFLPPFLGLVTSAEPEVQYVVLQTVAPLIQRHPKLLTKEIRLFFCKYNDPSYVKLEKLGIIVTVAAPSNIQLRLDELSERINTNLHCCDLRWVYWGSQRPDNDAMV